MSSTLKLGRAATALALAAALIAMMPSFASAKVWHDDFVTWSKGDAVGTCRIAFENEISCSQNESPFPNRFTNVNLGATGKPHFVVNQKFPAINSRGRQLFPKNRARWSRNGVSCRLNRAAGVRCSNGSWGFLLNPHSFEKFKVGG